MINKLSYKVIKQPDTISEQTFLPNKVFTEFLKNNTSNILVIKASNSSGKTYILEMLAFAFFGLELNKNELTESLQRRLSYLVDKSHQTFEFDISINDPDGSLIEIKYNKENQNPIIKKITGKTEILLTKELFLSEYKLLFDIPENPLDRIFQVTKSIKEYNLNLLNQLKPIESKIIDILNSINYERDENKIANIKTRIEERQYDLNIYEEKRKKSIIISQDLENHKNLVNLKRNFQETEVKSKRLDKDEEKFKKLKIPNLANNDLINHTKINEIRKNIKELNIKYVIKFLSDTLKGNKFLFEIIENNLEQHKNYFNNIFQSSETIDNIILTNDITEIAKLIRNLNHIKDTSLNICFLRLKSNYNVVDYNLVQTLIEDLKKYELYENPIFEELFNRKISIILSELKNKEKKYSDVIIFNNLEDELKKIINNLITKLELVKKYSNDLLKELGKNNNQNTQESEYNYLESELKSLKESIITLKNKNRNIRYDLENNGISLNLLDSIVKIDSLIQSLYLKNMEFNGIENQIIENKKSEINQFHKLIQEIKYEIAEDEIKLQVESDKKISIYSNHKNKMTQFKNKIGDFIKYITQNNILINEHGVLSEDANIKNSSYVKLIGEFVASTMGNAIIYQDETLEISHIDYSIKTPCFVTFSGKRIAFSDFSGGQASSNYLKSKLNVNDNKKYIVLFDEIANMDNRSLDEVIKKLKKLNEDKKLVLAILSEPHKEQKEFVINSY